MKLNWFSPLPPAPTDIAHFTMRVLPALSSRAEVTLWTDQEKLDPLVKQIAEVRTFEPGGVKWEELNRADACLYNIGNNPLFHGGIWQVARQHAGLVILHDTRLHHFFDGLYRARWNDLPAYLETMEIYYGAEGRREGAASFRGHASKINEMAEKFPLTEHALENAIGAIVHTPQAFAELSESNRVPVAYLPLPFSARDSGPRSSPSDESAERVFRLIMFGYIGRNRRLEAVLTALHGIPERDRFHLDVFGEILDNEKELKVQIRELGLKRSVTLHGFAPEATLDEALAGADLAINLRYPTMGEASGSQLRIWSHGKPAMVTNVGWYATLPARTVAHVGADENEVADIQAVLRAFLDRPDEFVSMGREGRKLLELEHSPEAYAKGLVEFVEEVKSERARGALLSLAERAGEVTSQLFARGITNSAVRNIANEIQLMSRPEPPA